MLSAPEIIIEGLPVTMKTAKQVIEQGNIENSVSVAPQTSPPQTTEGARTERNLHVKVETFSADGHTIGTRIVDMYHFGTRNWLQNHNWWAMHNNHQVETKVAEPEEVAAYMAAQKQALVDKFNGEKQHVAA